MRRGVPIRMINGEPVTTVFDLLLASYGVVREGLPGEWPTGLDDASLPYTPAWQEAITSVPASTVTRVAREFAHNAEQSGGRSMITLGAGTNHWFHSDEIYRAIIALVMMTGCQGNQRRRLGALRGSREVPPVYRLGTARLRAGLAPAPRQMAGTAFWYLASDQFRYDGFGADELASPLGKGLFRTRHLLTAS